MAALSLTTCCKKAAFSSVLNDEKKLSSCARNKGSQLVIDLNPSTAKVRRKTVVAKADQEWNQFMQSLVTSRSQGQRAKLQTSVEPIWKAGERVNTKHKPSFARIEAPDQAEREGLDERRRQLIEQASHSVSNASKRAAESAEQASVTAAKLARYARRRFQQRTGGIYTGTTIEDDIFPLRRPTRNEAYVILAIVFVTASTFAWRWQAKLDARGTAFTTVLPAKPKDPNKPKAPAPVPPIPELGANPRQKESAEWINMVISKVWKVYQRALESWIVQSLQPALDGITVPPYVGRVVIRQFYLGEEPITIRSVQRRISRRANDLQYNLALRYTGGARCLLSVPINSGPIHVDMPVGVRKLDLDAELWIKLRLVPTAPYIGSFTWAFSRKPKMNLVLAPFRFVNLMQIPLISNFLLKLLTEDLPRNFELPNKVVVDLMKDKVSGPGISEEDPTKLMFDSGFKGELNVTLIEAENLPVWGLGFLSDPHCILTIGQQEVRSRRDSTTSVRGKSGFPVWNQDFFFLIEDPISQKLVVQVRDTPTTLKLDVAKGAIDLANLPDLEPVDVWVDLVHETGFGPSKVSRPAGRLSLRLTYKSYVDDDDEGPVPMASRKKDGKTTLVEDLPEFDVSQIPDLVTNDIPVAVAEGVQKGIDALPEEIPAAIQKGIDAIPPEIPENIAAGRKRANSDMEIVQQNLSESVPPALKDTVADFQKGASDFWAEGIANAVENLGFGENTANVQKVDKEPQHDDIREVAMRDKSMGGAHDFTVFRDEGDVSELVEEAKASEAPRPPPLKVADVSSNGSTFSVDKERDDVSTELPAVAPTSEKAPAVSSTSVPVQRPPAVAPVASEALERHPDVSPRAERQQLRGLPVDGVSKRAVDNILSKKAVADVSKQGALVDDEVSRKGAVANKMLDADVSKNGAAKVTVGEGPASSGADDNDTVDLGETVEDMKQQLAGALENLKDKTIGGR